MTKKEKRLQAVPGMRAPKGQQKRFNLHIEMPHVDLLGATAEPTAPEVGSISEVASISEVTSVSEGSDGSTGPAESIPSEIEVTSSSEVARIEPPTPIVLVSVSEVTSISEPTSVLEVTSEVAPSKTEVTSIPDDFGAKIEVTAISEVTSVSEATVAVEWKKGYLRLPNWLVFNLLPLLDVNERSAYLELYTYTHGFNRNPHRISQARVAKSLKMSENTLRVTLERLEQKGLVARLDTQARGKNAARGTLFDVRFPQLVGAPANFEVTSETEATSVSEVTSKSADMKEKRQLHEKAPAAVAPAIDVFGIRMIAARLFEVHRAEPGFDQDRLRGLVEAALVGQGMTPPRELLEEAIRGMGE